MNKILTSITAKIFTWCGAIFLAATILHLQPVNAQAAASKLVSVDSNGKLTYTPYNQNGDRIIDFSYCGYRGNEVPLPWLETKVTVKPLSTTAVRDGNKAYAKGKDCTKLIQNAIDEVARMPINNGFRGAVLLKKGTYFISEPIKIEADGVVLRGEGAGPDGTVIIVKNGLTAIILGDSKAQIVDQRDSATSLTENAAVGGQHVVVADAAKFKVGDTIDILMTPNTQWVNDLKMDKFPGSMKGKKKWMPEDYQIHHHREISEIKNNMIYFGAPLPQAIMLQHGGGKVMKAALVNYSKNCGVEALRIVSDFDTSVATNSNTAHVNMANFYSDEKHMVDGIRINGANCWVRNVTVLHAMRFAIILSNSARYCTVRDCISLDPVSQICGSRRYCFNHNGEMNLFYRCYSRSGRHDFVLGARVAGPNAFVECFADHSFSDSGPHQRWATGCLMDNVKNNATAICVGNRGNSGTGHGWTGANMVYWNCDSQVLVYNSPLAWNFAIGYTGVPREQKLGIFEWYNRRGGIRNCPTSGFPLMGNGYIEAADRPAAPRSLFKQQLINRLGYDRAKAVIEVDEIKLPEVSREKTIASVDKNVYDQSSDNGKNPEKNGNDEEP